MRRLSDWLRLLRRRAPKANTPRSHSHRYRPQLESLEDRLTPASVGFVQPIDGVIAGTVFIDSNGNHNHDAGEIGLPGVSVTLTGTTNQSAAVNLSTTTDANGKYTFFQVLPGTYALSRGGASAFLDSQVELGALGGTAGTNALSAIGITEGQAGLDYNFEARGLAPSFISQRFFFAKSASVSSASFFGTPGSGVGFADNSFQPTAAQSFPSKTAAALAGSVFLDASTTGVAGVQVALIGIDYTGFVAMSTTTTAADGSYQFANLKPGTYTINVVKQPSGFRAGAPTAGSLGGDIFRNDQIANIVLNGVNGTGYNFAEVASAPGSGSGFVLAAELLDNTGSTSDTVTADPVVHGSFTSTSAITTFTAGFDAGPSVSILGSLLGNSFVLNTALLTQINGGPLTDGAHVLHLLASNAQGQTTGIDVAFTLLTQTFTTTPTLALAAGFQDIPSNLQATTQSPVDLVGTTANNVTVQLFKGTTLVDTQTSNPTTGAFTFTGVSLTTGVNNFRVLATDSAGNTAQFSTFFLSDPTAPTVNATNAPGNVVAKTLAHTATSTPLNVDLTGIFNDADIVNSQVRLNTNLGPITLNLLDATAPQTVRNYFNYVDSGAFTNDFFHRNGTNQAPPLGPLQIVQGGGFTFTDATDTITPVTTTPPVPNEFNATTPVSNLAGTLSMAKGSSADSATSQFFINLSNNSSSLDSTGNSGGFTVFANIASGPDQRVANTLAQFPVQNQSTFNSAFDALPLKDYTGTFPAGATNSNFALINSATTVQRTDKLSFTVDVGSNTAMVTAALVPGTDQVAFTVQPGAVVSTVITFHVQATDQNGLTSPVVTINITIT
jgi:peptidyl-prolyl cis-trans isomerase A (cyclophilin A)